MKEYLREFLHKVEFSFPRVGATKSLSSAILLRVVRRESIDVSEELIASIFGI
jgi:hypothetical protein